VLACKACCRCSQKQSSNCSFADERLPGHSVSR
jgi:hypothetical protein